MARKWLIFSCLVFLACRVQAEQDIGQLKQTTDRMAWWREARFGMFIHWGLYAVPAGQWKDSTRHGEWIMNSAQIPVKQYEQFVKQFNPVQFDANAWVRMAKNAGMKYIVITTKHHDGFCLFDSKFTDYDVMATPLRRDIMKEMADACRRERIRLCWYHSIMDWHHPDYLPRRPWENRSADGANFDRYVKYMHNQTAELLTHYGDIGVLWFDGQWEATWNHTRGEALYNHVRKLQPNIIVNNRVDVGRGGMEGVSKSNKYAGDFGTPEQQIPATGIPGVDWETCMTMNRHWGYNKNDHDWKSTEDLIRKLADIASKGGNFLLNVGPTAEGLFPQPSIDRLEAIGRWMKVNGPSIHGTTASPFKELKWGRCTKKKGDNNKWQLYLHVFDWPTNGELVVPALDNRIESVRLLADPNRTLSFDSQDTELVIKVPSNAPDAIDSVVAVEIAGNPVVIVRPTIQAATPIFIDQAEIVLTTNVRGGVIRFTLDGSEPTSASPRYEKRLLLTESVTVRARLFRNGKPISADRQDFFEKVTPRAAETTSAIKPGLHYAYYEGDWEQIPDFSALQPTATGVVPKVDLNVRKREEHFALKFTGFIRVPRDGIYTFYSDSDDGSRLAIGDTCVVDNDGLHGPLEVSGQIALKAGLHPFRVTYFEGTGGQELDIGISTPDMEYRAIPNDWLFQH